ncbi:MAG: stage V sporulation protein SpoVM [Clostridiales bacterium]|nr:stage V sporulation protein SpoVM [Clostridiales bacterium]
MQKMIGGYIMKIVVFRSPKVFSGILRLIFGIKKQEQY